MQVALANSHETRWRNKGIISCEKKETKRAPPTTVLFNARNSQVSFVELGVEGSGGAQLRSMTGAAL